jgi:hypothetical protein
MDKSNRLRVDEHRQSEFFCFIDFAFSLFMFSWTKLCFTWECCDSHAKFSSISHHAYFILSLSHVLSCRLELRLFYPPSRLRVCTRHVSLSQRAIFHSNLFLPEEMSLGQKRTIKMVYSEDFGIHISSYNADHSHVTFNMLR